MLREALFPGKYCYYNFPPDMSDKSNADANTVINIANQENNLPTTTNSTHTAEVLSKVTGLRATSLRKTSISMPSKLDEMDSLHINRQQVREYN